jgi:hypothetical protein
MIFVVWRLKQLLLWLGVICVIVGGTMLLWRYASPTMSPSLLSTTNQPRDETEENTIPDYTAYLDTYLHTTAQAVLTGETTGLEAFFDATVNSGRWALEHHLRRVNYVATWAARRGLALTDYNLEYRVVGTSPRSRGLRLQVNESTGYSYVYLDDPARVSNTFGIGARHVIDLAYNAGQWFVRVHWFLDALDGETTVPTLIEQLITSPLQSVLAPAPFLFQPTTAAIPPELPVAATSGRYERAAAVKYADTYCGLALGCGNDRRYNPQYRNYAGLGGDCTNFASQVLGDPDAGGLAMTRSWRYQGKGKGSAGSATAAWVSTDSFAHFLASSGKATRIARGEYQQVTKASTEQPRGAIGVLQPGDVIGYAEKGDVVHFSVVTALDSRGVPLVNSHTADRYHVPWDLGWERHTSYWLYHIRD